MTDRRLAPRRPLGDFVTAVYRDQALLCLGCDISEGGMFVRATGSVQRRLADHEGPIVLSFTLPGDDRVVWACGTPYRQGDGCDGRGTVLAFTYVPDHTRERLRVWAEAA